jgi:hypothetical protein
MGIAALIGLPSALGSTGAVAAKAMGMGRWLGADALRDTAVLAEAEPKRGAEELQPPRTTRSSPSCGRWPPLTQPRARPNRRSGHITSWR